PEGLTVRVPIGAESIVAHSAQPLLSESSMIQLHVTFIQLVKEFSYRLVFLDIYQELPHFVQLDLQLTLGSGLAELLLKTIAVLTSVIKAATYLMHIERIAHVVPHRS